MTFSRFLTLGPAWALWRHEIDHTLHRIFGKPAGIGPIPVWGRGASHAFSHENEALSTSALAGDPSLELVLLAGSGAGKFVNEADISPEEFSVLGDRGLVELVEAILTVWALTELRRVRFANPEQRLAPHDLNDLRALVSALVYCDIVVTDKAWCDAVRRTDLCKQLGTVVLNDVAKVEATVRRLTESEAD